MYKGLRKCHLRALHNVHEAAAREAFEDNTKHDVASKVRAVARNYEEEHRRGFRIREEHLAALRKFPGSDEEIYFDDTVTTEVNSYDGTLAVLEVLEGMTEKAYGSVFGTGGTTKPKKAAKGKYEIIND